MDAITILLIAIGLAMDSFSVSIAGGAATKDRRTSNALRMATFFAGFQAGMPVIGWVGGRRLIGLLESVDHWIAFGLLGLVGGRMIYESLTGDSACENSVDPSKLGVLLLLSVATSVDALAVGLSLAMLQLPILVPVIAIGLVTFVLSLVGAFLGCRFGRAFENKMGIVGGLILIGIGVRIVVEHVAGATPLVPL